MSMYDDFSSITGEQALMAFISAYGFQKISAEPKWNLGEYEMTYQGTTFRVGYRWYDPSQAFSIQRDIHKAQLWSVGAGGVVQVHGNVEFDEDA
ncbi:MULTISPECIES: hypothetical protein [Ralstonia]|uniref:hypothetical protein n=1 Tax=Ralstonia TaxID=48736 RepID=UPI000386DF33|nr:MULTISPECIES: hypothetical protein [Ralstonia]EPX96162.1 hypothetical protein C404_20095 [Ralstonia sp. AU12-08]